MASSAREARRHGRRQPRSPTCRPPTPHSIVGRSLLKSGPTPSAGASHIAISARASHRIERSHSGTPQRCGADEGATRPRAGQRWRSDKRGVEILAPGASGRAIRFLSRRLQYCNAASQSGYLAPPASGSGIDISLHYLSISFLVRSCILFLEINTSMDG